jgi:hypothetical protein
LIIGLREFQGTHQEESVMRAFLGAVSAVVLAFTVACSQTDAGITTAVKSKLAADDTVKAPT